MTRRYPEDRIRLEDVKHHPWFAKQTDSKDAFQKALLDRITAVNESLKQQAYKTLGALKQKQTSGQANLDGDSDSSTGEVTDHLHKVMLDYKQKTRKLRQEVSNSTTVTSSQSSSKSSKSQEEEQGPADLSPSETGQKGLKKAMSKLAVAEKAKKAQSVLKPGIKGPSRPEGYWSSSSSDTEETCSHN